MNTLRGLLNATAIMCAIYWYAALLAGRSYTWLLLIASCIALFTCYGWFAEQMDKRRSEDEWRRANRDLGANFTRLRNDVQRSLFDGVGEHLSDDILRRDPQAYPLQRRAVWPDGWSYE